MFLTGSPVITGVARRGGCGRLSAGDRWGPLGTAGDRWGPGGTGGDRGGPAGTGGDRRGPAGIGGDAGDEIFAASAPATKKLSESLHSALCT